MRVFYTAKEELLSARASALERPQRIDFVAEEPAPPSARAPPKRARLLRLSKRLEAARSIAEST